MTFRGRFSRCQDPFHRTQPSTASRSSSWSGLDARPGALAREFEVSAQAIRNWVRQGERNAERRQDGLASVEREEL
jgi:hypothetical protein